MHVIKINDKHIYIIKIFYNNNKQWLKFYKKLPKIDQVNSRNTDQIALD